jgi:hypothetical protein
MKKVVCVQDFPVKNYRRCSIPKGRNFPIIIFTILIFLPKLLFSKKPTLPHTQEGILI